VYLQRSIVVSILLTHIVPQDENQDGAFTVEEMIRWMDKHKLIKFVEEGRDADMDRIMERSQATESQKDDSLPPVQKP